MTVKAHNTSFTSVSYVAQCLHMEAHRYALIYKTDSISMVNACLLKTLLSRSEKDQFIKRIFQCCLQITVSQLKTDLDVSDLITQIEKFIDNSQVNKFNYFIDRNNLRTMILNSSLETDINKNIQDNMGYISNLIDKFCGHPEVATIDNFCADAYLLENEDVCRAIISNDFIDALDHFQKCGRLEKRRQRSISKES